MLRVSVASHVVVGLAVVFAAVLMVMRVLVVLLLRRAIGSRQAAHDARGVARDHAVGGHILGHDRARAHDAVLAHRHAWVWERARVCVCVGAGGGIRRGLRSARERVHRPMTQQLRPSATAHLAT